MTYLEANNLESIGGSASGGVTVADKTSDGQVALTAIPVSPNVNTTQRNIYRRFNAAGDYKLVDTIADNSTTTYTDNIANASLTTVLPTVSR